MESPPKQYVLLLVIFRIVICIYTVLTLPLYYLCQRPWRRLAAARSCGSKLASKDRFPKTVIETLCDQEYLEYEPHFKLNDNPFAKFRTCSEAIRTACDRYGPDTPFMCYREVVRDEIQYESDGKTPIVIDGKVHRKYYLTEYKWMTYGQVWNQILVTVAGLRANDLKRGDAIGIFAETGHRFLISLLGSQFAGATVVTLFTTLTEEGLIYAINEARVRFLFVGSEQLNRVRQFIQKCPTIEILIYFEGTNQNVHSLPNKKFITLTKLYHDGKSQSNQDIEEINPDDIFAIMYTSGTAGIPKGVIMTHRQIRSAVDVLIVVVRSVINTGPKNIFAAYLPSAHIMELELELMMYSGGVKIGYAMPSTLTESSPGLARGQISDLRLLKPTIMPTVPLVLERIQKQIIAKLQARTPISKDLFDYMISYKAYWTSKGYSTPIMNQIFCQKVREQFGGNLKYMVVGSALLSSKLQEYIRCALNVILVQGYGLTETCGSAICTDFDDLSVGRVGFPMAEVKVRMIDWVDGGYSIHDQPNPRGEIIVGGPNVATGYLNREDLTRESFFDDNGYRWFVTGDIGEVFPNGTFRIIDRKKDIVKLANGEFVSLGKIESILKTNMYVENICMVANGHFNCLIALVLPNLDQIRKLAIEHGFDHELNDLKELCQHEPIIEKIHRSIISDGINRSKLKSIELPVLILLCPERWGPENGLLTAAMKLKRSQLLKFYGEKIEEMWNKIRENPKLSRVRISD